MSDALAASFVNTHPIPVSFASMDILQDPSVRDLGMGDYFVPDLSSSTYNITFPRYDNRGEPKELQIIAVESQGGLDEAMVINARVERDDSTTTQYANSFEFGQRHGPIAISTDEITPETVSFDIDFEIDNGSGAIVLAINGQFFARIMWGDLETSLSTPVPYGAMQNFTGTGIPANFPASISARESTDTTPLAFLNSSFGGNPNRTIDGTLSVGFFNADAEASDGDLPDAQQGSITSVSGKFGRVITANNYRQVQGNMLLFDGGWWCSIIEI